ncbi:hypothetical protein DHODJN_13930 [Methylorubrum extorquens]
MQAVSWYLRYPSSYRDIEELFLERGVEVDHSTLNRWVLAYAPLIEKRLRPFRKPHSSRQRPRSRLWLSDGSYVRLRPLHRNHVWSFDFVQSQTHDGRSLHILFLIDEHSWACFRLKVARRITPRR